MNGMEKKGMKGMAARAEKNERATFSHFLKYGLVNGQAR